MSAAAAVGLSSVGKVFFGSLCAGTFGLGCWQTARLVEKQTLVAQRAVELQQEPCTDIRELINDNSQPGATTTTSSSSSSFRRIQLKGGTYDHSREILVGPRGPPANYNVHHHHPSTGKGGAAGKGTGGGGSGSMPSTQGYYVVTPLIIENSNQVVLVNRGWVPRSLVGQQQHRQHGATLTAVQQQKKQQQDDALYKWTRPQGITSLLAVPSPPEKPRFLAVPHNLKERPFQMFWFDVATMRQLLQQPDAPLVTALFSSADDESDDDENRHEDASTAATDAPSSYYRPLAPTLESVAAFKVSPAVHAAYALTWFSLSAAGFVMTRKLMKLPRPQPPPPS